MHVGKDVSGIVKDGETDVVLKERQGRRRHAQLNIVHKQRRAPQGKAGVGIARPRLVQSKSAMRVSAAGEKTLGQRQTHLRRRAITFGWVGPSWGMTVFP